jgi:hypothetical protein
VCYLELCEADDPGLVDLAAVKKAQHASTRSNLLSAPISELLDRVEAARAQRVVDSLEPDTPSRKRHAPARQDDDNDEPSTVMVRCFCLVRFVW